MTDAPAVPASILRLEAQWQGWLAFLSTSLTLQRDALPHDLVRGIPQYPIDAADAVEAVFRECCRLATVALVKDGRFSFDSEPYFDRFCNATVSTTIDRHSGRRDIADMEHITRARTFSPVSVYLAIASDYSSERVSMLENQALARAIHDGFSLSRQNVTMRAGCAVITMPAYSSAWSGKAGISYHSDSEAGLISAVGAVVEALSTRLGRPGYLGGAQARLGSLLSYQGESVTSRLRLPVTPDITVVFYARKFEVLIRADAAAALNVFLGQWLTDEQRMAA